MGRYGAIVVIICVSAFADAAVAQSMCIPGPVVVDHLEGTVLFEASGKSATLPDVTVSISPYVEGDVSPVASSVTKGDGRFSIEDAKPGRYWLSFRHRALIGFSIELHLRPRSRRPTEFLIATLRNDPNKPCGGGSVHLSPVVEEACRSLEYENQNQTDYALKLRRVEGIAEDTQSPPSPVPRTCVGLFTEDGRKLVTTVESDRDGKFAFGTIQAGKYRLVAKQPGLGVANVILEVGMWPSGGILTGRQLVVHLRPRGIDITSWVDSKR
jgi:hypothetical protein